MKEPKEIKVDQKAIRHYMLDREMSVDDLADEIGVSAESIDAQIEWGYMLERNAEKVARALNVNLVEITGCDSKKIKELKDDLYNLLVEAYDIRCELADCYSVRGRKELQKADAIFAMAEELTEDDE